MVGFPNRAGESGLLVDAAGGKEDIVCPQRQFLILLGAGGSDALVDQATTEALATCGGFDVEQPQFCNGVGRSDDKDRADNRTVLFSDPALLVVRIEGFHQAGEDLRGENFISLVPVILLCIQKRLAMNDPANV